MPDTETDEIARQLQAWADDLVAQCQTTEPVLLGQSPRRQRHRRRARAVALVGFVALSAVGVLALRSDPPQTRTSTTAPPPLATGVMLDRIEAHGDDPDGTQDIRFVFDGPLAGDATYVDDLASLDSETFATIAATGIGYATQDGTGPLWVCAARHFGLSGSVDLLVPAEWIPPGTNITYDPVPWAPAADPLTGNSPGKIAGCGPYKGYIQYSIWAPASVDPENIQVSIEPNAIRVVIATDATPAVAPCPGSVGRRVDGDLSASADALPHIDQAVTNRESAEAAFEEDRAGLYEEYGAELVGLAEGFGRAWKGDPGQEGVDYTVVDIDDFGILLTLPAAEDCPIGSALYVWSTSGLPLFFLAPQA